MRRPDDRERLRHMLDSASEAQSILAGRPASLVLRDRVHALALVRLLEVIGEAATKVSSDFRAAHPEIPWLEVTGLRNRLVHGYYTVDLAIVEAILEGDLPPLIRRLEEILEAQ